MPVTLDPKYGEFRLVQSRTVFNSEGDYTLDWNNVEVKDFSIEGYKDA